MMWMFFGAMAMSVVGVSGQFDTHQWANRSAIVHLFEWKWSDIAVECEAFLSLHGYAGVQVSPPIENVIIAGRPWWERYQPISYRIRTRSGDETAFADMTRRCNRVGVRIYVDIIINHMAGDVDAPVRGTGGSTADPPNRQYPAVPYGWSDFNPLCGIDNYNDRCEVRNCELLQLHDLNQANPWVRWRIRILLDRLVAMGVAGFRIDAAKHMWPSDLYAIYERVGNLKREHGFELGARPFVVQEVVDMGGETISRDEYTPLGAVTEFRFSAEIGRAFRGADEQRLSSLRTWGEARGFMASRVALVFVDNHDNQRGSLGPLVLTHKDPRPYRMASAFMLAHPYGLVRVMSSFAFDDFGGGPPHDADDGILSPNSDGNDSGECLNGWVCEHRWPQTYRMVEFRNVVGKAALMYWWDNGGNQIAFGRGGRGFVAFNNELAEDMDVVVQTGMPVGRYCDLISGYVSQKGCTGAEVEVDSNGRARISLAAADANGMLAFHLGVRVQ